METKTIKVLLIEDNPGDARLVREALTEASGARFQIQVGFKLSKGIELLAEDNYDIILLDLSLPDSQGLETFFRARAKAPQMPIILMTGLNDENMAMQAVREGAQDYIVKGQYNGSQLARSIRYAIERQRTLAARVESHFKQSGKILGFIGAKGGVGTTTVALNVAAVLTRQKGRVLAVEITPFFSAFSFHLQQTPEENLAGLLELPIEGITEAELMKRLYQVPFGASVLFGPQHAGQRQELDAERAAAAIQVVAGLAEQIVVDLPSYPCAAVKAILPRCDFVSLVVEREPGSVRAGKAALETLRSWSVGAARIGLVVVNRTALAVPVDIGAIAADLGCKIWGVVPPAADACVMANNAGKPLVLAQPDTLVAEKLAEIANRFVGEYQTA